MSDDEEEECEDIETVSMATAEYIKTINDIIKLIDGEKPQDRLQYMIAMAHCLNGFSLSIKGWTSWINHLDIANNLTMEDFQKIYPIMKEHILALLKLDSDISRQKLVEFTVKKQHNGKKTPQNKKAMVV